MHGDDILDDVSIAAEADGAIRTLTGGSKTKASPSADVVGRWSSSGLNRPSTAPPKRFQPPSAVGTHCLDGQLQNPSTRLHLNTSHSRPASAKPRPTATPGGVIHGTHAVTTTSKQGQDTFRPISAPSNRNLSVSKVYLKKAANDKRARERDFATELFQEKADYERKIALKIGQANKLMRRHNIPKVYSQTKNRDNFILVKVVEGHHERVMSADVFYILFVRDYSCSRPIHVSSVSLTAIS
ncbi:hypothetical protein, variant [Aphanomyces astaci]|uniref:Uncharacterized protein n=1 Tax=Aphanomyces astaci TaxID=112090 RepID=W4GDC7_APHAT|nr:hypothetical protein, variant [Aphanomyces astaci]ETV77692.1 hypothetical protein, variant [Aphanomyces astaci]|eukprot:XP_009832802.1 hypothetical protein, variant [Aphanomyces astaci]